MFKGSWQQLVTKWLLLLTPVVWVLWDAYAYFAKGVGATESYLSFLYAYHMPGIGLLVGILIGHLFFPQRQVLKDLGDK